MDRERCARWSIQPVPTFRLVRPRADAGSDPRLLAQTSRFAANGTKALLIRWDREFAAPFSQDQFFEAMSGSPPDFLAFIETELKPFVASRYAIDSNDQTLQV